MAESFSPDDVFDQAGADAELDWGAALAEQAQATPLPTPTPTPAAASPLPLAASPKAAAPVFPNLQSPSQLALSPADLERVLDVPVRLTAELGRTRITIKTLLQLAPGSVLELDGLAGEPMDLFVNGYLIAQGEVVVVGEKYGIRVTDIVTPSERMQKLNR
jgi:flagellar motor switch protein FliN